MAECTCSVEEKVLDIDPAACGPRCQGCTFSNDITCTVTADDECVFTGSVYRTGCANFPDKTWNVNVTMDCGSADRRLTYHCDDLEICARYEVTLKCMEGTPPGGGG